MGLWVSPSLRRLPADLPLFNHERYVNTMPTTKHLRLLTSCRLRRLSHGFHQCRAELYRLLQSSTRGKQRHWNRVRDIPNWPDGRGVVQLGLGLARASMADIRRMSGDMHWCHCDGSRSDDSCVHWRALHAVVLLYDCNSCSAHVSDRDCTASAPRHCGWVV